MQGTKKVLSLLLAIALTLGMFAPTAIAAEGEIRDYATFVSELKVLEGYAESYAQTHTANDAYELAINFIRTGVDKYTTGSWTTLAGAEITGFTNYVAQQDAQRGTTASNLRNLKVLIAPNGQELEFEHMFGAMNIAYVNSNSADIGSWAGDLCDLLALAKGNVSGDMENMVKQVRDNFFGRDEDEISGFGWQDVYGDLDAFYLMAQIKAGESISSAMENYFTTSLTDNDRAAYFLNNRFKGLLTKEDVRNAIFNTYSKDVAIKVLEADYGITAADADARKACCYCFADYLYELAADRLTGEGGEEEEEDTVENFYSVFSSKDSTLAPGIDQTVTYALTREDKQLVYYYLTLDLNNEDVLLHANYKDHDPSNGWGMSRVPDQMAAAQKVHGDPNSDRYIENYNVVAGTNGDFYNMTTGKPAGSLVMDGIEYHPNSNRCFFALLKDGTPVIGKGSEWAAYEGNVDQAVAGSAVILRDGKITASAGEKAPRTAIGITEEGKVILIVIDGRQDPFSVGTDLEETAQLLLDAGCVIGLNLDGGGSSTFVSKPEGSDSFKVINSPSDGYVRSVSSSLVIASTAVVSNEFDHALISSEYDYLTPGTALDMTAIGVSDTGNSAELPANAEWAVSDDAVGMIENGVFTALDFGEVDIQLVAEGEVVGSKTVNVVIPDAMNFTKDVVPVVYGVKTRIPVELTYNGNPVAFNDNDLFFILEDGYDHAGTFEGPYFTASEDSNVRTVMFVALLLLDENVINFATLNMYKAGEAVFDFESATAGNRTLAWNRVVNNATTEDECLYQAIDPTKPMDMEYTFALDMEYAEIPGKLKDLTYMLPGGDVEGTTAWEFLLRLAERVSDLTEVTVTASFSKDLKINIDDLKIANEYFEFKNATIDEESNTVTITVKWIDQTVAIDPATANPVCIVSGIKASVKEDAEWSENSRLDVVNLGAVGYNIFMRANALYSFACDEANSKEYSLVPYIHPNNPSEKGASFSAQYVDFEDSFTLSSELRQGWVETNGEVSYYVDNVALVGNHKLPSYDDPCVEYIYGFDENGICTGTLTGLIELDGKLYYAVQGEVKTGWRTVDGNYYYFEPTTGAAVDGYQKVTGYYYTFENCILTKGSIVKLDGGYRYYWAGGHLIGKWIEHEGNTYYATYPKGYFAVGMVYARNREETASHRYLFSDTGVLQNHVNGLHDYNGNTYYVIDGEVIDEPGLVYHEGYYYYFSSTGAAVKGRNYWITKTNGLLPAGAYYFDEQGRMTNPPTEEPPKPEDPDTPTQPEQPVVRDGIVEVNGVLYYYVNGNLKYGAGLIKLDGYYYYVRSNAQLAIGRYWVTTHNDLLPQGMYTFGEDGKMIDPPDAPKPSEPSEPSEEPSEPTEAPSEEPTEKPTEPKPTEPKPVKEGIYEEGGVLYFYENGTRAYCAGLIKYEGFYYYVRSNGQLAIGKYWITTTNGLLPQGMYNFGEDGKMINPPDAPKPSEPTESTTEAPSEEPTETTEKPSEEPTEPTEKPTEPEAPAVKEGIYREGGALYFYENGTRAYCKGLIFYEGYYYYVRSNAQLAIGKYWTTTTNGLLPEGMYEFDQDGRMIR